MWVVSQFPKNQSLKLLASEIGPGSALIATSHTRLPLTSHTLPLDTENVGPPGPPGPRWGSREPGPLWFRGGVLSDPPGEPPLSGSIRLRPGSEAGSFLWGLRTRTRGGPATPGSLVLGAGSEGAGPSGSLRPFKARIRARRRPAIPVPSRPGPRVRGGRLPPGC